MNFFEDVKQDIESVLFHQVCPLGVLDQPLKTALVSVDRLPFLPPANRDLAYADAPIILKRRCEFPFFVLSLMLQSLEVSSSQVSQKRATVVSAGTGFSATLLSHLCDHIEAFEPDSILFSRLIQTTKNNEKIKPVTTLSTAPVHFILMDGGAYLSIMPCLIEKLSSGGKIAVIEPCAPFDTALFMKPLHPDVKIPHLPLCNVFVYTKSQDGTGLESPRRIMQVHMPILFTHETQKECFNF